VGIVQLEPRVEFRRIVHSTRFIERGTSIGDVFTALVVDRKDQAVLEGLPLAEVVPDGKGFGHTGDESELVDKLVLVVDSIQLKPERFIFLRKRVVPGMRDLVTDSWAVRRGVLPTPAARGGVEVST